MSLSIYRSKRHLDKSPEPRASSKMTKNDLPIFVIQRHDARALHFDLRLEYRGVLLSWAITKKPVLNNKVKRLAVMVEDHPLDYADFKGIIPQDNYGAGTVQIWDQGTFLLEGAKNKDENEKVLDDKLKRGHFIFYLKGQELNGKFVLVKLNKSAKNWLFYYDEEKVHEPDTAVEDKAQFIKPMIPTLVDKPFNDPGWIFEPKLDGYRTTAVISKGQTTLFSRNGRILNDRFPEIQNNLKNYQENIVFDGEIVAFDSQGRPNFSMLRHGGHNILYYYIFDILFYKRTNLTSLPLHERKQILSDVIKKSDHIKELFFVENDGINFFSRVIGLGFEGMVGKDMNSKYQPGTRTRDWLKVKTTNTLDLYVVGFISDDRSSFKSLMVAEKQGKQFSYLGNVGTGFNAKDKSFLSGLLKPSKKPPNLANYTDMLNATFVEPKVIIEVGYLEKTPDGRLRHPVFRRVRDDK